MQVLEMEIRATGLKNYEAVEMHTRLTYDTAPDEFQKAAADFIWECKSMTAYVTGSSLVAILYRDTGTDTYHLTRFRHFEIKEGKLWGLFELDTIRAFFIVDKDI